MATVDKPDSRPLIVVLGATGQQGGAVMRNLQVAQQWRLAALVRNAGTPAARSLLAQGVQLRIGDMDDPASLSRAFVGAHGVFSVQPTAGGADLEVRQGCAVIDAAKTAQVRHFVYASVGGADRASGVPHFESKWEIETRLKESGLDWSVVRPVFFMENFSRAISRLVVLALLKRNLSTAKALQMIAVDDVGRWVARAFADRTDHLGLAEEIAGDELTFGEILTALKARGLGGALPVPSLLVNRLPSDVRSMFGWFGSAGYRADIARLKTSHELGSFAEWLQSRP